MDSAAKSAEKIDRRITEMQRLELKKPFGVLESESQFFRQLHKAKYEKLIAVGDITTILLLNNNLLPDVAIVDFICNRKKIPNKLKRAILNFEAKVYLAKNPPGTITYDLISVCREVFLSHKERAKVYVDGEEDLAVIPAVIYAPKNSIIVYGQPQDGVVMVRADEDSKGKAAKYLNEMEEI